MSDRKAPIPPRDSWLTLDPGVAVRLDPRLMQDWAQLARRCREIRGAVLAGCFEIEYLLDQLIAEVIVPTADPEPPQRALLDELFLKGRHLNFNGKIQILKKLRARVPGLEDALPTTAVAQLDRVRVDRNDFAHYPVTFEPIGEIPNQTLRPILATPRRRIDLSSDFLREHGAAAQAAFSGLEAAMKALREHPTESGERT